MSITETTTPATHPLQQRLVNDFAAQWLDESNIDAFVNADGDHVLFLMGDTHRFAQGLDVAVVLPELQSMHPQRFDIGVVRKEAEDAIAKRFASRSWPALIFVRQGQYVGVINGMHDWDVFIQKTTDLLAAAPTRLPIAIPVVGSGQASSCA